MECPICTGSVAQHKGFVAWCACGWNATPHRSTKSEERDYQIGEKIFNTRLHKRTQKTVFITTFFPPLLVVLLLLLCLILGIKLIIIPFILAKFVGLLFVFASITMVKPLVTIPISKKNIYRTSQNPEIHELLQKNNLPVKHLCYSNRFGVRLHHAPIGHKLVLEIGVNFAQYVNPSTLEAAVVREYHVHQLKQRYRLYYFNWARKILIDFANICMDTGSERERWLSMQTGGILRTPAVNQWVKVFLIPFGLIPYFFYKNTGKLYLNVYHSCIYQANERTAKVICNTRMKQLLSILSLEEPALFYQRDFNEREKTFPPTEYERLLRVGTEERFFRPMISWQLRLIETGQE